MSKQTFHILRNFRVSPHVTSTIFHQLLSGQGFMITCVFAKRFCFDKEIMRFGSYFIGSDFTDSEFFIILLILSIYRDHGDAYC